jgi:hypothetical protein
MLIMSIKIDEPRSKAIQSQLGLIGECE